MLTGFDHLIVGVRDLDAASAAYERLGFAVRRGGRNPGQGTHNAIIRFGLDYLELLSVHDVAEARAASPRGGELADFLMDREGGAVGFVVRSNDVVADADRARAAGFEEVGVPVAMQRSRPDGSVFAWRLLIPGARSFRRPWPFVIEWQTPDAERLRLEAPAQHPNGAHGVAAMSLLVESIEAGVRLYGEQLGLPIARSDDAQPARADLPACPITLVAPTSESSVPGRILAAEGEGPYQTSIAVDDLAATARLLAERGVAHDRWPDGSIAVGAADAVGARLVFVTQLPEA